MQKCIHAYLESVPNKDRSILFNPAAVEVIDVEEGADILARAPFYFTVVLTYDNTLGRVDACITLIMSAPPLDPIAELVHVTFHCKGEIDTPLDLQVIVLLNVNANMIPPDQYTVEDGFVNQYTTPPVGGEWVPIRQAQPVDSMDKPDFNSDNHLIIRRFQTHKETTKLTFPLFSIRSIARVRHF